MAYNTKKGLSQRGPYDVLGSSAGSDGGAIGGIEVDATHFLTRGHFHRNVGIIGDSLLGCRVSSDGMNTASGKGKLPHGQYLEVCSARKISHELQTGEFGKLTN